MTEEPHRNWPEQGPNPPTFPSAEYGELSEAIQNYLEHSHDDPKWDDIWRAIAVILGEHQRDRFTDAFDLVQPAERACIAPLISDADECPHSGPYPESGTGDLPHSPPADDHSTLWLNEDDEPAVYGMHVYPGNVEQLDSSEPPHNQWFDIFEFAQQWSLEVSILTKSWYNLGGCVHVIFY